jgi:N-acetylglucosamine repressor
MPENQRFASSIESSGSNSQRKERLKQQLVSKLHKEGQLSIHNLCESFNHSAPTIAKTIDALIKQQLVIKTGVGGSSGGRRPGLYSINPSSHYVMAVDLERSFIRMGIFDFANKPASKIYEFNDGLDTLSDVFQFITSKVAELLKNHRISKKKVLGIGLSLPGLIDIHTGLSYTYLMDNRPVAETLSELTQIKTYVEHDTKLMALGEQAFGLAKGIDNVLCLNMGSGIGLSMILNGTIYRGHSGYAGEFGHIQIDNKGDLCHCGKVGCIETQAAGKSLIAKAGKLIESGIKTELSIGYEDASFKLSTKDIIEKARAGDKVAIELLNDAGDALGKGLAVLINIFNPELIILGGELSKATGFLIAPIENNLEIHSLGRIRKDAKLVVSELGDNARIMGSVALVMNKIFA